MNINEAIEQYEKYDELLGYEHRGYPACVGHLNGVVAIADDTGDNGTSLEMYTEGDFIAWMTAAKEGLESGKYAGLSEAVGETTPEPSGSRGIDRVRF